MSNSDGCRHDDELQLSMAALGMSKTDRDINMLMRKHVEEREVCQCSAVCVNTSIFYFTYTYLINVMEYMYVQPALILL